MLHINDTAPNFTLLDAQKTPHTLTDYQGQWLILYFYPKDHTPGCTQEACTLRDDFQHFSALKTQIIGVSTDKTQNHHKFTTKHQLNFPLLADPKGKISQLYGALFKLGPLKFSKRHSFIINPTGKIAKIYRNVNPSEHSQELLTDLQHLQSIN